MFDFGLRLRELRERQNLSQDALGRIINRSKSVISSYENNIRFPSVEILIRLAVLYHVTMDYLVGIEKHECIVLDHLTEQQRYLIHLIVSELNDSSSRISNDLTPRQEDILNHLMHEFSVNRKYYIL